MQLIRCTKKLLVEMGVGEVGLYSGAEPLRRAQGRLEPQRGVTPEAVLGAWYANLIFIDRKKCLLFANEKTLANFLVVDVARKDIRERLPEIFRENLRRFLTNEGFPAAAIQAILADCGEFVYARTQSKQVLGCMNDMAFNYRWDMQDGMSLDKAMSLINRAPFGKIFPIDELKALVSRTIH